MSGITFVGELKGHRDWVTALVCPTTSDSTVQVVSASRDNTIVSWVQNDAPSEESKAVAIIERRLEGHSDFVQGIAMASGGGSEFVLSASCDKTLCLWNLKTGNSLVDFEDHLNDVLACAFSSNNRHIISGGRDGKLILWNVRGENKYTFDAAHQGSAVSSVCFSPVTADSPETNPLFVSGGWDNVVRVWSVADFKCKFTLTGHTGHVTSVVVSPDGSLCASGSKDGTAHMWDLASGKFLYALGDAGDEPINQVAFSPSRYWLAVATDKAVRIWDLETRTVADELFPDVGGDGLVPKCTSIAWSADGGTLYAGYTDKVIRIWAVSAAL